MTDVSFTPQGPPSTVLPEPPATLTDALAGDAPDLRHCAAGHPSVPLAWAELADSVIDDPIQAYAFYRVGYHRGLDLLRKHGWRGSGYVRWDEPSNRGFLRCVQGLGAMATVIGESEEAERCAQFLNQLDPGEF